MNAISASILVLAAAVLITGHDEPFLQILGGLVGVTGLVGWFFTVKRPSDE